MVSKYLNFGLDISLFMIMASNIGPSRIMNSIILCINCNTSLSLGNTTFIIELNSLCREGEREREREGRERGERKGRGREGRRGEGGEGERGERKGRGREGRKMEGDIHYL